MIEYPISTKRFVEILTKDSFYCGFIKDSLFYVGIPFGNHGRKIIILDFEKLKETQDETLVYGIVPIYDEWQESQKKRALWFEENAKTRNRLSKKIKLLEEQLNYALETMGQIAKLSDNTVDSVQCAHAICLINERIKEMKGVK